MTIVCLDRDERELRRWSGPVSWAGTPSSTPVTYLGSNYGGALVWVSEPPAASAIMVGMAPGGSGGTPIKQWMHPDTHRIRMTVQAMAPAPALNMPPASSPDDVLVVRMGTSQPYINETATRVAYDGMDNVFIIHYRRADGKEGEVHVPHWLFTEQKVITDVLEYSSAGVSVPARYTPYMVPRLWPYMRDARDKWAREFNEMAHASTGMLATATILTLRPLTAPVVAPAVAPTIAAAQPRMQLAPAQRSTRTELFRNKFPGHPAGAPLQEFTTTQVSRSTFSRKLNYVVMEDGTLKLGRINNNAIGGGHIDLAGGAPVRAAGEVTIVRGRIQSINNASGHYQPSGTAAQAAAEKAFGAAGFDVAGKYVQLTF